MSTHANTTIGVVLMGVARAISASRRHLDAAAAVAGE